VSAIEEISQSFVPLFSVFNLHFLSGPFYNKSFEKGTKEIVYLIKNKFKECFL
jgi:hypothetical protein